MPFTMPNYEMPSQPELGNPLSSAIGGLLAGVNAAPKFKKEAAEAKYAGITAQANAMSKIAYASLLGPQYIAKLMANPSFWHSLPDEMKDALSSMVLNAGTGQTNVANSFLNPSSMTAAIQQNNSNSGQQDNGQPNPLPQNPRSDYSPPDQSNTNPMRPNDESTQPPLSKFRSGAAPNLRAGTENNSNNLSSYDKYGNNIVGTQQDIDNAINHGQQTLKGTTSISQPPQNTAEPQQNNKDGWAKREGQYESTVEQLKAEGKGRGENVVDLGHDIKDETQEIGQLNQLKNALMSPVIQSIKTAPIGGHYQLAWYAKGGGTPEQAKAAGSLISTMSEIATNMTQRYKGSFKPNSEMPLINAAKPNENDTIDSALGKLSALLTLNNLDKERNTKLAELEHGGMNESDAIKEADKWVDGEKIRKQVTMTIYPSVFINGKRYFNIDGKMMKAKED